MDFKNISEKKSPETFLANWLTNSMHKKYVHGFLNKVFWGLVHPFTFIVSFKVIRKLWISHKFYQSIFA